MKRRLLSLGIIIVIAFLLAPIFRNFVREVIVIPLLYIFWIGRFLLETIPQEGIWGLFSTIFLLIFGISLLGKQRRQPRAVLPKTVPEGRVAGWMRILQRAQQDTYFKWRLAQQLQKVALRAIAHQKQQSLKQTRQQLRQGMLEMPPEIHAYFKASLQSLGHLPLQKRFFQSGSGEPSPLDLEPRHVVQYLEQLIAESQQLPTESLFEFTQQEQQ